jgi:hypothetical protein
MKLNTGDAALLGLLASMPFLDRLELAAVSGRSRAAVYERVGRMSEAGLLDSLAHSTELVPTTRRYCLTAQGVRRLAALLEAPGAQLLRRHPVSEHWRRLLLERLDSVAAVYRLCETAAQGAYPLSLRWYRAAPMDALLVLPGNRRVAIVRLGPTSDRTAFAKRIRRLRDTPGYGAVLLIAPDETRLRHARRLVGGTPAISFLALERDVILAGPDAAVWRGSSGAARLTLPEALGQAASGGQEPAEPPLARVSSPWALPQGDSERSWLLPAQLSAAEKRVLDLTGDWPWIRPAHLAGLLGVGERRLAQLLSPLDERRLLTRVVRAGNPRLALSDRGLAYLARRDRASVGAARKRWSAEPRDPGAGFAWRNIGGSRARQLVRNLEHTESVHWFNASLAAQTRDDSLTIAQLDPSHRASCYFRFQERLHSIHPDAFGMLRTPQGDWSFFLEWERRAVRPATMAARLAPYLRYYATRRPIEDQGIVPAVLVVFEDALAADQFLRIASQAVSRTNVEVPLLVSDRGSLIRKGPLGETWRSPASAQPRPPF